MPPLPSIRISQSLYDQARQAATQDGRSVAGQVAYWAKVGRTALDNPDLPVGFIAQSLQSLSEARDQAGPFIPRSHTS